MEIKRLDISHLQRDMNLSEVQPSAFPLALKIQEGLSPLAWPAGRTSKRVDFLFHEFIASTGPFENLLEGVSALNDFLFREKKFRAIDGAPVSDGQIFLGKVIEERAGDALSLALIFRELVRKMNMGAADFVNFPGMAAVKVFFNHQLFILNPAESGKLVSIAELQSKLARRQGGGTALSGAYLETPSEIQIVSRFLSHLKTLYFEQRDWSRLLAVMDILVCASAGKLAELKERGLLLYQLGLHKEAREDLQFYVLNSSASPEVESLRKILSRIQKPQVTPVL